MTTRGMMLIALAALLTAGANLMLRGSVLKFGHFSLSPDRMQSQLWALSTQPLFLIGVLLYGTAALVWFSVLSVEDLSVSYPILVGLSFVLVASGASMFFQEALSVVKLLGMAMILGGILVVARA